MHLFFVVVVLDGDGVIVGVIVDVIVDVTVEKLKRRNGVRYDGSVV